MNGGPQYETSTEISLYKAIGGDSLGILFLFNNEKKFIIVI